MKGSHFDFEAERLKMEHYKCVYWIPCVRRHWIRLFIQVFRPLGDKDIVKIVFGGGHFEIQDGGRNCSLIMCVLLLYERAD